MRAYHYARTHNTNLGPADITGHCHRHIHLSTKSRARQNGAAHLLYRAELCNGPIEHVEMIEEIDRCPRTTPTRQSTLAERAQHVSKARTMDREPLVEVFSLWKLYCETEVS